MKSLLEKFKHKKLLIIISSMVLVLMIALIITIICINFGGFPAFNGSQLNIASSLEIALDDGLVITDIGDYTGMYLEDGSDDVVSGIMMIALRNDAEKDLQLARVNIEYDTFTAEFEATNIPSGATVILLEKNRHSYVGIDYKDVTTCNVVFFSELMSLMKDTFSVSVADGSITVTNLTDKDISGTTYVYYKNTVADTYYGGITYRAKIDDVIPAGDSVQVLTSHFSKKNSELVQVVNIE